MAKTQLSKADQIRKLLHLSNAEIAERTGEPESYIRTVRQRTSEGGNPRTSPADSRWYPRYWQRRKERYAADPEYREHRRLISTRSRAKRRAEARAS